ncbi:MAG: hypothetical protein ACE5H0_00745 [Bacteroidota bacterium]
MNIRIVKENPRYERRVALTPAGVQTLVELGANLYVYTQAGCVCPFSGEEHQRNSVEIVCGRDELFGQPDNAPKLSLPTETDNSHRIINLSEW